MLKRFKNIKKKINNILISKKYYASIPLAKKNVSFEEEYHDESLDPDGKKRKLLKERKNFLSNNKHIVDFLKKSKPGKIIDHTCRRDKHASAVLRSSEDSSSDEKL